MSDIDMEKPALGTVEAAIPEELREAIFAALSLYSVLKRPGKVRLSWRGGVLVRAEVHGLCWPFNMPSLTSDAMDVAVTLQNAGFDAYLGAERRPTRDVPSVTFTAEAACAEEERTHRPIWRWYASRPLGELTSLGAR